MSLETCSMRKVKLHAHATAWIAGGVPLPLCVNKCMQMCKEPDLACTINFWWHHANFRPYNIVIQCLQSVYTASNLLMDFSQQRLKLADFGCAELLEETDHPTWSSGIEKAGTLAYNPPEVKVPTLYSHSLQRWRKHAKSGGPLPKAVHRGAKRRIYPVVIFKALIWLVEISTAYIQNTSYPALNPNLNLALTPSEVWERVTARPIRVELWKLLRYCRSTDQSAWSTGGNFRLRFSASWIGSRSTYVLCTALLVGLVASPEYRLDLKPGLVKTSHHITTKNLATCTCLVMSSK